MYNKLSANYKRQHVYNYEDEPPEKKLISDGDLLIKELSQKQRNTEVNLNEELSRGNQFYKSTEVVSVTQYASGSKTLEEFNSVLQYSDNIERLKSYGLTDEEVQLFLDYKDGMAHLKNKSKNINESIVMDQLRHILEKIKHFADEPQSENPNGDRLQNELTLAAKPDSVETKLLKFALNNQQKSKEILPGPMDQIKDIEKKLMDDISHTDIKKIRKKARSLSRQIAEMTTPVIQEPLIKSKDNFSLSGSSKWDMKECSKESKPMETKVFTCKPQNYYTVKDGKIFKINVQEENGNETEDENVKTRLSVEEIKKIPKFEYYNRGTTSKILYLKNLANGVQESDLENILGQFAEFLVSVNIMKGKMRGQAFLEFKDEHTAEAVLDQCNGVFLKNKPIIMQFGKRKSL